MSRPLVVIESPLAGDTLYNIQYAQACCLDSISRGEAPFASHLFYTQILDDCSNFERIIGMTLGWEFTQRASHVAVYCNLGLSPGMQQGIDLARTHHKQIIYRQLWSPPWPQVPDIPQFADVTITPAIAEQDSIASKTGRSTFTLLPPPSRK